MSFFVKRKKGSLDAPSQSLAHTSPPLKTTKKKLGSYVQLIKKNVHWTHHLKIWLVRPTHTEKFVCMKLGAGGVARSHPAFLGA